MLHSAAALARLAQMDYTGEYQELLLVNLHTDTDPRPKLALYPYTARQEIRSTVQDCRRARLSFHQARQLATQ